MNPCSEFSCNSCKGVIHPRKDDIHSSSRVKTPLVTLEIQMCVVDFAAENKYGIDRANLPPSDVHCRISEWSSEEARNAQDRTIRRHARLIVHFSDIDVFGNFHNDLERVRTLLATSPPPSLRLATSASI
jgi:hypothetical protein